MLVSHNLKLKFFFKSKKNFNLVQYLRKRGSDKFKINKINGKNKLDFLIKFLVNLFVDSPS